MISKVCDYLNYIHFDRIVIIVCRLDENAIKSRSTIIEIRIPADCVRSIIGPQGSVVKEVNLTEY